MSANSSTTTVNQEKDFDASKAPEPSIAMREDPPDGGFDAWLTVLGSFLALSSTFGVVNSYGVFQSYYTTTLLVESSSSTISFIGALQLAILYGAGPIIGKIFDAYGLKILMPLGSLICVVSLIIVSLCKENQVYQYFLVQAVLFGLGNAMIFTPSLAVIGHWFKKRRAYVLGIVGAGSSLGGVVFPIMLERLIGKVGFAWAVRITALVELVCLAVACFTMKTRLSLTRKVALREVIDMQGFRDIRYVMAAAGSFLYFYALFIPYFYVQEYASFHNVSPQLSGYLLAIINAMGMPARVIPGILADSFGVLQILVPSSILAAISVLAIWLPARGPASIVAFCSAYGLFSGAYVSLLPAYVATITPIEKFGARLGSIYPFVAVACLLGTPTAGVLIPSFTQTNFNHLIMFTGVFLAVGAVVLGLGPVFGRIQARRRESRDLESSAKKVEVKITAESVCSSCSTSVHEL